METKMQDVSYLKLGDGVTVRLYTDSYALTIIEKTDKKITAQRDNAKLDPSWKPNIITGGFTGHCTNNHEQKWICTPNPNGIIEVFTKRKNGKWIRRGAKLNGIGLSTGRHHFHDYNF